MNKVSIFDPTCVLNYGHNLPALLRYMEIISRNGSIVTLNVCKELDSQIVHPQLKRTIPHYYGFSGIPKLDSPQAVLYDVFVHIIENDRPDVIFFPNIDAISIEVLQKICENTNLLRDRKVILRFIGVMENDFITEVNHGRFINSIGLLISSLKLSNIYYVLGAESERYSTYLRATLDDYFLCMPFPLMKRGSKPIRNEYVFGFLGSPREDKGWKDIPNIARSLIQSGMLSEIVVKILVQQDDPNDMVTIELSSDEFRNSVILLDRYLSHNSLIQFIKSSSVLVLPYDVNVYKYRGSAMLFEGVEYGIPSVAIKGSAFADEIEQHGLGSTVDNLESIALECVRIARMTFDFDSYIASTIDAVSILFSQQ